MHSLRGLLAWVTLAFLGSRVVFQDLKDWLAWRFPASAPACSRRPSTKGRSAFCFRNYSDCSLDEFTDPPPLHRRLAWVGRPGGSAGPAIWRAWQVVHATRLPRRQMALCTVQ